MESALEYAQICKSLEKFVMLVQIACLVLVTVAFVLPCLEAVPGQHLDLHLDLRPDLRPDLHLDHHH